LESTELVIRKAKMVPPAVVMLVVLLEPARVVGQFLSLLVQPIASVDFL
jgi:hypothetical protein